MLVKLAEVDAVGGEQMERAVPGDVVANALPAAELGEASRSVVRETRGNQAGDEVVRVKRHGRGGGPERLDNRMKPAPVAVALLCRNRADPRAERLDVAR